MQHRTAAFAIATAFLMQSAEASAQNQRTTRDRPEQVEENAFQWGGELAQGGRLFLRSINGSVRVEPSRGRTLEISARKAWRRGDPATVRIEATRVNGNRDVLVCARWTANTVCNENTYSTTGRWPQNQDTRLEFTIHLPAGAHASVNVTNGDIEITGASGEIDARTTNGEITAESSGTVEASTTNGDVNVTTMKLPAQGASYRTTNGTISLTLPNGLDADVQARTTNGSIASDFDITTSGTVSSRSLMGKIGRGGPRLNLATTNGSIRISKK